MARSREREGVEKRVESGAWPGGGWGQGPAGEDSRLGARLDLVPGLDTDQLCGLRKSPLLSG